MAGIDKEELNIIIWRKASKAGQRSPASSATQCRARTRDITIRHTFTVSFRDHSIREGMDTSGSYLRRVGLVPFVYFLRDTICSYLRRVGVVPLCLFVSAALRVFVFVFFILFLPCMVFTYFRGADIMGRTLERPSE